MVHKDAIKKVETIKEKITFEGKEQKYVVVVKTYHTRNGILNAEDFMHNLFKAYLKIEFIRTGIPH